LAIGATGTGVELNVQRRLAKVNGTVRSTRIVKVSLLGFVLFAPTAPKVRVPSMTETLGTVLVAVADTLVRAGPPLVRSAR
jgi:hypothetical protein